jgi:hypothetical protein
VGFVACNRDPTITNLDAQSMPKILSNGEQEHNGSKTLQ